MHEIFESQGKKWDKKQNEGEKEDKIKKAMTEKEHDKRRVKFMEMLVKEIPKSKHRRGIYGIYRYVTIPFWKVFRRKICGVHNQWSHDFSVGVTVYDDKYYNTIKDVLEKFDEENNSDSTMFGR